MTTVLIVCGAGASSTFLASRLRSLAKNSGLELTAIPSSESEMRAKLHSATVLLVGPHLKESFDALQAEADLLGIPTALLPPTAFGSTGAVEALALVESLVTLRSHSTH